MDRQKCPEGETSLRRFSIFGETSAKAPAPHDTTRGTPVAAAPRAQPAAVVPGLLRPGPELRAAWELGCREAETGGGGGRSSPRACRPPPGRRNYREEAGVALGRTPGADPCGTQRGKGAAGERLPLSPLGAKRERSAETRDSDLGAGLRGCRQQPEGIGALSSPGAQTPERSPPSQLPKPRSRRPPPRRSLPPPGSLRYDRRRCPLRPAPRPPTGGKNRSRNRSWEPLSPLQFYVNTCLCRP